jgi:hypothetical protein
MGNSYHIDCLHGKTSSVNTRFNPRKPIPLLTSEPEWREVDGDTRPPVGARGDVHGTNLSSKGTPRSREPKSEAMVDNTRTPPNTVTQ